MSANDPHVVTEEVVYLVDGYVRSELSDATNYTNRAPLDESGIWSLHRLVAEVYAKGFDAGERVEAARNRGVGQREATRAGAVPSNPEEPTVTSNVNERAVKECEFYGHSYVGTSNCCYCNTIHPSRAVGEVPNP